MKKGLLLIAIVVVFTGAYFAIFSKKENKEEHTQVANKKQPRLIISKNPAAFNDAFIALLNSYYNVKNALINWDSSKAGNEARTLNRLALQLPVNLLKADNNLVLTAKNFTGAIAKESETLASSKTIEEKRRAFSNVSNNLYNLINTVRYDKEVIYYDMCPMAFHEEEEAYWLSRDSAISNPYLGNKHPKYKGSMAACGNVEQTIDFANAKK